MRAALVTALLASSTLAAADAPREFPRLGVWKNTVKNKGGLSGGVKALTSVSHVLYLNDCRPNGCIVSPGGDDSRTNRSSIAETQVVLSAWGYGDDYWNRLVQCVKDTYAAFDIQIVTQDPGTTPHFEVMIGGRPTQLHPQLDGAGGVAPFIDCSTTQDNVISFVFSEVVDDLEFLCGAVAQEATHVWGLDHVLDADDPMTYLELGSLKRFQNRDRDCGEDLSQPRQCFCGGSQQNSVRFFNNVFGPATLTPASLSIVTPTDGQWVKPGFPVRAELDSQLSLATASLSVDGSQTSTINSDPLAFNAPTNLPGGDHTVTVTATDNGNRTVMDSVTVHVTQACSSAAPCPTSFHCLGGFCLPGANEAGGLGSTCTANEQCITGQCTSDGTDSLCAGPCDAGNVCPSGFECVVSGGTGTCWPGEPDDGGCQTGSGGQGFAFAGLALLGFLLARRRR